MIIRIKHIDLHHRSLRHGVSGLDCCQTLSVSDPFVAIRDMQMSGFYEATTHDEDGKKTVELLEKKTNWSAHTAQYVSIYHPGTCFRGTSRWVLRFLPLGCVHLLSRRRMALCSNSVEVWRKKHSKLFENRDTCCGVDEGVEQDLAGI